MDDPEIGRNGESLIVGYESESEARTAAGIRAWDPAQRVWVRDSNVERRGDRRGESTRLLALTAGGEQRTSQPCSKNINLASRSRGKSDRHVENVLSRLAEFNTRFSSLAKCNVQSHRTGSRAERGEAPGDRCRVRVAVARQPRPLEPSATARKKPPACGEGLAFELLWLAVARFTTRILLGRRTIAARARSGQGRARRQQQERQEEQDPPHLRHLPSGHGEHSCHTRRIDPRSVALSACC